ncbi:hypothetical protein DFH09DRAFT_1432189 [Mycena vulgaris]|nr:hypothetical protein DFH09DRAFT_1432189 [Mycena vulgaris]
MNRASGRAKGPQDARVHRLRADACDDQPYDEFAPPSKTGFPCTTFSQGAALQLYQLPAPVSPASACESARNRLLQPRVPRDTTASLSSQDLKSRKACARDGGGNWRTHRSRGRGSAAAETDESNPNPRTRKERSVPPGLRAVVGVPQREVRAQLRPSFLQRAKYCEVEVVPPQYTRRPVAACSCSTQLEDGNAQRMGDKEAGAHGGDVGGRGRGLECAYAGASKVDDADWIAGARSGWAGPRPSRVRGDVMRLELYADAGAEGSRVREVAGRARPQAS